MLSNIIGYCKNIILKIKNVFIKKKVEEETDEDIVIDFVKFEGEYPEFKTEDLFNRNTFSFNDKLNELNRLAKTINKLNTYKLSDNKALLICIMNCIFCTNPFYNIYNLDLTDEKLSFQIETVFTPNDFISFLNKIYNKTSSFIMTYNMEKSYVKDIICYNITIDNDINIYTYLEKFLYDLNNCMYNGIYEYVLTLNTSFLNYLRDYRKFDEECLKIENFDFGNKESILNILKNNIIFLNQIL